MFDYENVGSRFIAAFSALAISTLVMAFAIVPAMPAGVVA